VELVGLQPGGQQRAHAAPLLHDTKAGVPSHSSSIFTLPAQPEFCHGCNDWTSQLPSVQVRYKTTLHINAQSYW
jgi:hypothetical protein